MEIVFKKIENANVFTRDFSPLTSRNHIQFPDHEEIVVIYGPNGTGKTSLVNEDGIQLPFTYIGSGKMEYIEGSKKANGAHLFRVPMDVTAPEDIYFDFKLPS